MVKVAVAGRVKTRLARDVGTAAATRFVRTATASLLHRLGRNVLRPFGGVRWSGPHALADTLLNLSGAAVALLDSLSDVDTGPDLERCSSPGRIVQKKVDLRLKRGGTTPKS
jgi:glycosyltransferase A (GT-A) superfamily protein (DUF2064 family)